jgi:hypothetical protein
VVFVKAKQFTISKLFEFIAKLAAQEAGISTDHPRLRDINQRQPSGQYFRFGPVLVCSIHPTKVLRWMPIDLSTGATMALFLVAPF